MFTTTPSYAQFTPAAVGNDQQWWRAVTLFAASYWFLFVYEADREGEKEAHTAMAFDEWTLLALIADKPPEARKSVCRIAREVGLSDRWTPRWLESVLIPAAGDVESTGVLLLRFEGEAFVRDAHMNPLPPRQGRTVLFQTASEGAVID